MKMDELEMEFIELEKKVAARECGGHDYASVTLRPAPAFVCIRCGATQPARHEQHANDIREGFEGRYSEDYWRLLWTVHAMELHELRASSKPIMPREP